MFPSRTISSPAEAGTALAPREAEALAGACERVLRANWREGTRRGDGLPYAFTCPSPPRYRHMWHWDSCFHAIAWARISPYRAREELRTILRSGREDGFLPHTVFWDRSAGWRRAPLYATARPFGDRFTESIGPPLTAFAWERVARASEADDPGFATEALDALGTHLDWLARERDPRGEGLLRIVLPDESGLDDSPKYDVAFGRHAHHRVGYYALVERCRMRGWRGPDILAASDLQVADVLVNVAYVLSLDALGRLSGDPRWAARARRTEAALLERCWDEEAGLFWDLAGRAATPVRVSTWASLAPLVLPSIPEVIRRRLVEEHLLDSRRYGAMVGIPSVSLEEPSFRPGFDRYRCWRGPSWVNTAWLFVPALRELGYVAEAERIAGGLGRAALSHGLREYYDPRDGTGLAARGFGWSALLADLV